MKFRLSYRIRRTKLTCVLKLLAVERNHSCIIFPTTNGKFRENLIKPYRSRKITMCSVGTLDSWKPNTTFYKVWIRSRCCLLFNKQSLLSKNIIYRITRKTFNANSVFILTFQRKTHKTSSTPTKKKSPRPIHLPIINLEDVISKYLHKRPDQF